MLATARNLIGVLLLFSITVFLMPVQVLFNRFGPQAARTLAVLWHKSACRALNITVHLKGEPISSRPVLLVSNHVSWLDILVLSRTVPVSFVAKREVAGWPFFGTLAKLQRTVFVDRERRSATAEKADEIAERLTAGDAIVLFAEGTSTTGAYVRPFRSALFGSLKSLTTDTPVAVQPVSIAYTKIQGLPIGFAERASTAFIGDMDLAIHLWGVIKLGAIDVELSFGKTRNVSPDDDRKMLAQMLEADVRAMKTASLQGIR